MKQSDWKAYLVQTTTGVVGPEVSLKDGADFSIPLDDDATASFSLDKTDLPAVDIHRWLDTWWSSLLITFQGRAVFCGPIISNPREYAHEIQFNCAGVKTLLSRRVVIDESVVNSATPSKGVVKYKGLALGSIAQEVVKMSLRKPGGNLPMAYPSPYETATDDANHQRTYNSYNAMNLKVDEVLKKISEVSNGPDIAFRPKLVDGNSFRWEMHHGTENNPRIAQDTVPEFDLTAVKGQAASLEITKTGTYLSDRVISVGGGTNEAAVMAIAQDYTKLSRGYPLLETVITNSESTNKSVVLSHAQSTLKQNRKPLREFTLFVDAYGPYPLGTYWPGDMVIIYSKGFFNLPDGENKMRLLNMSGGYGANKVRLALQLDDQWE